MQASRLNLKLVHPIWVCLVLTGCGTETTPPEAPVESEVVVTGTSSAVTEESHQQQQAQTVQSEAKTAEQEPAQSAAPAESKSVPPMQKEKQKVYRPSDERPDHNNQRLSLLGIECYESPRLKLYTDIDPKLAQKLPAVIEQFYPALENYFGPLPPNREGTEFQVTGYIMQDRERFEKAGVIPGLLARIINGRHQGAQFWMESQTEEYYLRHLMLHEYTHCYSMIMKNIGAPVWYLEGIAESMATHRIGADGKFQFNVMPHNKTDFAGLGRISLIQEAVQNAPPPTMLDVMQLTPDDFAKDDAATYSWSWALCQFFDKHPRYQAAFRELSHHMQGAAFSEKIKQVIGPDPVEVNDAWLLFARNLQPGYDSKRAMISFVRGQDLEKDSSKPEIIDAYRGWQSSGVHVTRGETYKVSATGMFTLAQQPKPWKSTADGISFQYFNGQPLGRLLMMIRPDPDNASRMKTLLREYPQGAEAVWMAPASGTVYFRLNDAWNSLNDNEGAVQVKVTRNPQVTGNAPEK
ncbi:hypothetical protein [Gimesia panareensis]|uniref:hypothetical protein n=1 Tax=Gimesia panareensis TaxID=2527978 RepID=UPI0011A0BEA1|nr:hypothetical protein [Gimesia panareensis]